MAALAIAAGIFAVSFGFVADADRNTPPAAAAPGAPRHEVSSPGAAAPRVALGSAVALGVRPSLLARSVRRARARRVVPQVAPVPAPDASLPSTPPTDVPAQPASPSTPVGAVPTTPVPAPAPTPAPSRPAPRPVAKPAPKPVAKPAPKPVAKPAPKPKPPDFDETGPPAPGKGTAGG
jgi:hypothetical protein